MFLYIYSVIQGIVQGITELLPISSTAHLKIVNAIFSACGCDAPSGKFCDMFDVVIQLGSILAFLVYFHEKLIPAAAFRDKTVFRKTFFLWLKAAAALVPTVIAGFLAADYVEELGLPVILAALFLGGIALIVLESLPKKKEPAVNDLTEMSYPRAIGVGVFQCLALIPGVSRSAATIIGGLVLGASRPAAVEFSFFLAIPTMFAASAYSLLKHGAALAPHEWAAVAIGFAVSFFVSWITVVFFMRYIRTKDFKPFGYYRIAIAIVLAVMMFAGLIS